MNGSRLWAIVLAVLCLASAVFVRPAAAGSSGYRQGVEAQFRDWLAAQVWPEAQRRGVSRETFERAFDGLTLDWTLPELSPPGGTTKPSEVQRQPEFSSPGRYFVEAQLAGLARTGRGLLARWAPTLDAVERRYGVPREIVVAIWGRESGFGQVRPSHPALRVLATQAFMGRRKTLYFPELLAALQILQEGHLSPAEMKSSWAGAMGQPQFLPSKFLRYAVDFDGDGRRDIWGSVPDILASIANYLREHGWRPERPWGYEVEVPAGVSCTLEGPDKGRPLHEWERLGVTRIGGGPLSRGDGDQRGFLLMPAGRLGPAFLVSENFYVLKRYNESDLYALFIGHVADRMRADAAFAGRWTAVMGFSRGDVRAMQERLQAQGHDVGRADGLVGFATRVAIGRWQAGHGSEQTCFPTSELIRSIR